MKKRMKFRNLTKCIFAFVLTVALLFGAIPLPFMPGTTIVHAGGWTGTGDGSAETPWLIGTAGHESDVKAVLSGGTLTISGTGAMQDFQSDYYQPWESNQGTITAITIQDGVTAIGEHAFKNCKKFSSVVIPASVESIGFEAFDSCYDSSSSTGLSSITFAANSRCTSIGTSSFYGCKALASFTLPASVTSIGNVAFLDCTNLSTFTFAEGSRCTGIGDNAFEYCDNLATITIPAGVTSIGDEIFFSCNALSSITFAPDSQCVSIGEDAFCYCPITSFTIPIGVTSIGDNAFWNCNSLATIYAPLGLDLSNADIRNEAVTKRMCAVPTASSATYTYNGTEKSLQVTAPTNVGYTLSGNKQTNVGIYTATATLSNASYVWSDLTTAPKNIANWSITPKEVGLTWGNTDFTYTGNVQTPVATATGLVGNDTCAVTVTGGQTNVGTYTATATELSNTNYVLPANNTTSFTIKKEATTDPGDDGKKDKKDDNKDEKNNDDNDKKDPEQVNNFVERMYTTALGRASEAGGKKNWSNQLLEGKSDGATLARGFICSKEFTDKNMSDEEFVDTLYHTFFDRNPDEAGKAGWLDQLKNDTPRTQVLAGFVNSAEFGNLCEKFGIARGTMEADGSNIYNEGVYNFVKRNYTKTLGRKGEVAGIEDWCHRINTGELSMRDVAVEFLNSQEFLNKNTSNEEYVKVLYRTFMDREADASGLADWTGQLDRGDKTRDEVVNGFADSLEFANIMAQYQ